MTEAHLVPNRDLASTRGYWLPFLVFGIFTSIEGYVPLGLYPWVYLAKTIAVTMAALVERRTLRVIQPSSRAMVPAVVVGVVVFAQWILIDKWVPYPSLGSRVGFDPFAAFQSSLMTTAFLAIRLFGLVILVPVIEELFWRGFALRYLTNEADVESVPMGVFSASAFWIVTVGSAATHPEWLVALIAFALYAWLLRSTRSLFAAIVAHAVTNAALGLYILLSHDWRYW